MSEAILQKDKRWLLTHNDGSTEFISLQTLLKVMPVLKLFTTDSLDRVYRVKLPKQFSKNDLQ